MKDPHDLPEVDGIERLFAGRKVKLAVALAEDIAKLIDMSFGGDTRSILGDWADLEVEDDGETDEASGVEVTDADSTVIRPAHQIVIDAHRDRASDIHVEPCNFTKQTNVRFRIDGTCTEYEKIPGPLGKPLVARFKIIAHLDIAERRKPQDGKLRVRMGEREIELRVATIPTVGGNEDVILRLLPQQDIIPLDRQGLSARNLSALKALAEKPYGLILCAGPTGSGKTTTLHAVLSHINTHERKIWTAEDPVEITQPGLRQVQIRPKIGYTFAAAMRAFLRGDPDVIMVGEMRDAETAAIAIEASLTGHLVLSTLHTNSARQKPSSGCWSWDSIRSTSPTRCSACSRSGSSSACARTALSPTRPRRTRSPSWSVTTARRRSGSSGSRPTRASSSCAARAARAASTRAFGVAWPSTSCWSRRTRSRHMILSRGRVPDILRQSRQQGMTTLIQDGIVKVLGGITDFRQVKAAAIR